MMPPKGTEQALRVRRGGMGRRLRAAGAARILNLIEGSGRLYTRSVMLQFAFGKTALSLERLP